MYFLIILIPFAIFIGLLVRQNKLLSDVYERSYQRIWKLASGNDLKMTNSNSNDLDTLITDDSIKDLEHDLSMVEQVFGKDKSFVVSNTFTPKKKKLAILEKRISKLEAKSSASSEA